VHSHAVHFFALAAPDILLGIDSDPALRNIVGLVKAAPEVATKALRLRSIGAKVVELIGGRGTHPVSCVAGGMAAPLAKEKKDTLKNLVDEGVKLGGELFAFAKKALTAKMDLVTSLPLETSYLGTVKGGALDFYQGDLRLRSPDGKTFDFSEDVWTQHLSEEAVPTSYAKSVYFRGDGKDHVTYRVGPLARLNACEKIDTPLAQAELEEFRKIGGNPCHQTVMYHYARLIELLHSLEKLAVLAKDDELYSDNVRAKPGSPKSAIAHVEAPRGVLIHDYKVDPNGIVESANLLVATQQNIPSINATIGQSAQRYLDKPDALLLNAIEVGIRCYDPCLSCATHRVGEMKLDVVVRERGEVVRRATRGGPVEETRRPAAAPERDRR
jgi:coenzyme F420-reducing hydrogenase alpha subunit